LAAGRWVICDRFSDSTRVYQGVAGGLSGDALGALERLVVAPTQPELTLFLDLAPGDGLARARARGATPGVALADTDPFERRDPQFHERLRAGYLAIAKAEPQRCVLIDGAGAPDTIAAEIWGHVERRLLQGVP
jgi:dTMP kinase